MSGCERLLREALESGDDESLRRLAAWLNRRGYGVESPKDFSIVSFKALEGHPIYGRTFQESPTFGSAMSAQQQYLLGEFLEGLHYRRMQVYNYRFSHRVGPRLSYAIVCLLGFEAAKLGEDLEMRPDILMLEAGAAFFQAFGRGFLDDLMSTEAISTPYGGADRYAGAWKMGPYYLRMESGFRSEEDAQQHAETCLSNARHNMEWMVAMLGGR